MNFRLNPETIKAIEKSTKMDFDTIITTEADKVDEIIGNNIGKPLTYDTKKDSRIMGRGSVYLSKRRFLSQTELENGIERIIATI